MSTVQQPQPEVRRPRLEISLERLQDVVDRLSATSTNYQQLKAILQAANQPGFDPEKLGLQLQLQIGNTFVPIPPPEDLAQYRNYVQEATMSVGGLILELWQESHAITTEAMQHCASMQQPQQAAPQQPQ